MNNPGLPLRRRSAAASSMSVSMGTRPRMEKKFLTPFLLLALSPDSLAQTPAGPPAWAREVDALFQAWDRPDSPGCALGVIQDGKLVHARGYGQASLEHSVPIG